VLKCYAAFLQFCNGARALKTERHGHRNSLHFITR